MFFFLFYVVLFFSILCFLFFISWSLLFHSFFVSSTLFFFNCFLSPFFSSFQIYFLSRFFFQFCYFYLLHQFPHISYNLCFMPLPVIVGLLLVFLLSFAIFWSVIIFFSICHIYMAEFWRAAIIHHPTLITLLCSGQMDSGLWPNVVIEAPTWAATQHYGSTQHCSSEILWYVHLDVERSSTVAATLVTVSYPGENHLQMSDKG